MGETKLSFTAHHDGQAYAIGADLSQIQGAITFDVVVYADQPAGCAQLLKNGEVIAVVVLEDGRAQATWSSEVDPEEPAWFRCDVRDAANGYLAVTNPFYTGPHRKPVLQRFGDFLA